jgi:hypothetical protein
MVATADGGFVCRSSNGFVDKRLMEAIRLCLTERVGNKMRRRKGDSVGCGGSPLFRFF